MFDNYDFFKKILLDDIVQCPFCKTELVMTSIISIGAGYYQCPECRREYYYCNGKFTQK